MSQYSITPAERAELETAFQAYTSSMFPPNADKLIYHIYPPMFEQTPSYTHATMHEAQAKADAQLEGTGDMNGNFKFESRILQIEGIAQVGNKQCALIKYELWNDLGAAVFKNPAMAELDLNDPDIVETIDTIFDQTVIEMQSQTMPENVEFRTDKATRTMLVITKTEIYAIKNPAYAEHWTFLATKEGDLFWGAMDKDLLGLF